jgi:tetratricopeptide (TPR) repeat protein
LNELLQQDPGDAAAWLALAQVDASTGHVRQLAEHALAAAGSAGQDPGLLCEIAASLVSAGADRAARDCLDRAAACLPESGALRQRIALEYQRISMHDQALSWMETARAAGQDDPASRFCYAVQLTFHARLDEAERVLASCASLSPPFGRAVAQLSQLRTQTPSNNHLRNIRWQLTTVARGSEDHAALEFARYKECEDLGEYGDAWDALHRANAIMHELLRHDSMAEARTFDILAERMPGLAMESAAVRDGGPMPIFIFGMPRSGTTLLDRLVSNHSEVCSAGELGTFRRCLQRVADRFTGAMLDPAFAEGVNAINPAELGELYLANSRGYAGGRRFYVDKMPRNWLLAPLIHAAIPGARMLHMVRDPMDVAFSNYRSYFGGDYAYCYDFDALARHCAGYQRLMRQWHRMLPGRILDVSYRRLVSDPEAELRRVFEFCGLPWQDGCADPSRNRAAVATPSAIQVLGGIDTRRSERWRPYARQLSRLRAAMADVLRHADVAAAGQPCVAADSSVKGG